MTVRCQLCPLCGELPGLILSLEQVFCDNEQCSVISWNMTKTLDENLTNTNMVRLPDWLMPPERCPSAPWPSPGTRTGWCAPYARPPDCTTDNPGSSAAPRTPDPGQA